jgi:hypothetical protein
VCEPPSLRKVNVVIIKSLGKQAFHRLLSSHTDSEIAVGAEVEWYADRDATVLGTVGFGWQNKGWSYVMLKRDTPNGFRVCERQEHFSSRHRARVLLLRQMTEAEKVGAGVLAA